VHGDGSVPTNGREDAGPPSGRAVARLREAAENAGPGVVCLYFLLSALPFQADFALLALAGATIPLAVLAPPHRPVQTSRLDIAIILWLGIQAVAVWFSADPKASFRLSAPLVPAILVYYLISTHVRWVGSLRLVYLAISALALALATVLLWTAWRFPWTSTYRWAARLGSPMIVVPNDFTFVALVMPLSALFLAPRYGRAKRIVAGLSITISLAAITLLRSRVSLLTAFVSLTSFAALKRPRLALVAVTSLLLIFVATDAALGFALLGKFFHLANDEGVTGRISLWSAAWVLFLESPWTGHGPHTFVFESVRWVHNLYLEALAEQGIPGFLALLILLSYGLWSARDACRSGSEGAASLGGATFAALAGFCFAALFELTFLRQWVPLVLFTLLGVAARLRSGRSDPPTIPD
jgi:O-antigen ligase